MKHKTSAIILFLVGVVLTAGQIQLFGQTPSDKIIFLTDSYSSFLDQAQINDKDAESSYQESIQTAIYEKYFQKSEYAAIAESFLAISTKDIEELRGSIDRINSNRKKIEAGILKALKNSRQYINNGRLSIYIIPVNPESKNIIQSMKGVMGLTAGSKQIILVVEPDVSEWNAMLEYAVAHEYNHAYWTRMNFSKSARWTLLDYLVFEGRADYFAHLLYPDVKTPWTMALTEHQKSDLWNRIKLKLQSEDFLYQQQVMFGSAEYPYWGGYSLGYDIVQSALAKNKELKIVDWLDMSAEEVLRKSKYKY